MIQDRVTKDILLGEVEVFTSGEGSVLGSAAEWSKEKTRRQKGKRRRFQIKRGPVEDWDVGMKSLEIYKYKVREIYLGKDGFGKLYIEIDRGLTVLLEYKELL